MDSSISEMSSETFERLFKEYQICHEHASRLESYIWQTATLLGVGSIVGLVSLAGKNTYTDADLGTTVIAAVFAINVSLVWWRFAKRWWSIQHVKFDRMDEIDERIGFQQSILVRERNREAMSHIRYLQENGPRLRQMWYRLQYFIPDEIQAAEPERIRNYEHRGNQPAGKLLVVTNIALWFFWTVYAASQAAALPRVLVILVILLIVDIWFWRRP